MIQNILESIDSIDDITTEFTINTMNSMIDSYEKSALILENYEGDDLSSFTIFQEGEIMDDVKEQGQGQSTLMKILSFIPRLIKAIFHKIKKAISKGETPTAVNKELQKAPKEVKKALPILFDNKKDKKSKVSTIKKILIGASTVGAAAIVGKNVMSKSKSDDDSSNAASKMIGLFTKLKNVLKRKSETEKKLEEVRKETPPKSEGVQQSKKKPEQEIPRVPREILLNNGPTTIVKLKQELKTEEQEIEEIKIEAGKLLPAIIDNDIYEKSQEVLNNLDKIEQEKISELIATLKNYESKKDTYYKDLDKEISKLIEKCESKHKQLVSAYTTIKDCCHRIVDKCPVTLTSEHKEHLNHIDETAKDLESGNFTLLEISRNGEEISLSENIGNSLGYTVSSARYTIKDINRHLKFHFMRENKLDDSSENFKKEISDNMNQILKCANLGRSNKYFTTKIIIDPSKKNARSERTFRNHDSVFDNSLVGKADLEDLETCFTETKDIVEKINKERPEEIRERNIDNVMIYVSALVELAHQMFTFACGATNLVKEFVNRVSEINKKYEGERNKLFNNKSE